MDYRATLNLPQTSFKMKANLSQKEPMYLKRWEKEDLYGQLQEYAKDRPLFVLHDGPPYANGHIHLGTAFNKILKDIILKSRRMAGFNAPYVPGWDCHGLPIEHNVDKDLGEKKKSIPKLSKRTACRKYAQKWIKTQKNEFKRLGVLGEWDKPYLTMNYAYEASIAREFNKFLLSGAVVRNKKPVYWCSTCTTALAEAEVEYYDHTSPSIYVKFPVVDDLRSLLETISALGKGGKVLYLADNAGEIVYDSLVVECLVERGLEVTVAVKGTPVVTDALVEDAIESGLDRIARVITNGTACSGTPLGQCSDEFLDMFSGADLIISKGQGNFETLAQQKRAIFFIFTIKCHVVGTLLRKLIDTDNDAESNETYKPGDMVIFHSKGNS